MSKYHIRYNWKELQKYYNEGHTWAELTKKFGVSLDAIHKAVKRGDFVSRNASEARILSHSLNGSLKHSEETKQKISESRTRYLRENPDKVPYLINHSSKKSYPEKLFYQTPVSAIPSSFHKKQVLLFLRQSFS
jgi:predicted DNA-binding protein YlxM (UPF0122 family)